MALSRPFLLALLGVALLGATVFAVSNARNKAADDPAPVGQQAADPAATPAPATPEPAASAAPQALLVAGLTPDALESASFDGALSFTSEGEQEHHQDFRRLRARRRQGNAQGRRSGQHRRARLRRERRLREHRRACLVHARWPPSPRCSTTELMSRPPPGHGSSGYWSSTSTCPRPARRQPARRGSAADRPGLRCRGQSVLRGDPARCHLEPDGCRGLVDARPDRVASLVDRPCLRGAVRGDHRHVRADPVGPTHPRPRPPPLCADRSGRQAAGAERRHGGRDQLGRWAVGGPASARPRAPPDRRDRGTGSDAVQPRPHRRVPRRSGGRGDRGRPGVHP